MRETTRALANLPSLDVELVHDRSEDGTAERVAIRFTGRPDLETAAKSIEPHLLGNLALMNPWLAHPWFQMQAQMMRAMWAPVLQANPMLQALLPPPARRD